MESLESEWQQLRLTSKEDNKIILDEDKLLKEINKGKYIIIGKLHMKGSISKEVIRSMMLKIWKTTKPFFVFDFASNTYIFSFANEFDLNWVMFHQPWLIESSLLSLKLFDGCNPVSKMDFSKESF